MIAVEEEWGKTSRSKHPIIQLISDFIQEEEEEEEEEDSLLWRHLPSKKSNVGRPPPRRHNAEEEEEECFKSREKRKETLVVPHTYRISGVAKNKGVKSLFTSSRRILLS